MVEVDPSLRLWAWFFLFLYMAAMLALGFIGMRRVQSSDDFATARGSYGPLFLAFALTATTASGGTFIGIPALAYQTGFSSLWYAVLYPLGVYAGLFLCLKGIRRAGDAFGTRSMPEYLGDRYDSDALRICASVFSILLLYYLAAQLLSGAVMFNRMMGIDLLPALVITAVIIMIYIAIGGAHADILTDGIQGALMLVLALTVTFMFFKGFGIEGGFGGLVEKLRAIDPALVTVIHPTHPVLNAKWDLFSFFMVHAPLGLLPHIGNKLWALKSDSDQNRFLVYAFSFGLLLPTITFGGIAARAVLGDALLVEGANPNAVIPVLFIATFPAWLAALIGAGVLAAIMSTADGLVVSTSQIFANDIYRRTIVPKLASRPSEDVVDRMALKISRLGSILVVVASIWLAWRSQTENVALLIAGGVGGMIAAICGPMFAGILWRGTTKVGALAGFAGGGISFFILKTGALDPLWFTNRTAQLAVAWLDNEASNFFSCGALGALVSLSVVVVVSLFTKPPTEAHLRRVFGDVSEGNLS